MWSGKFLIAEPIRVKTADEQLDDDTGVLHPQSSRPSRSASNIALRFTRGCDLHPPHARLARCGVPVFADIDLPGLEF